MMTRDSRQSERGERGQGGVETKFLKLRWKKEKRGSRSCSSGLAHGKTEKEGKKETDPKEKPRVSAKQRIGCVLTLHIRKGKGGGGGGLATRKGKGNAACHGDGEKGRKRAAFVWGRKGRRVK